jgi:hypothetical protein
VAGFVEFYTGQNPRRKRFYRVRAKDVVSVRQVNE